MRQIITKTKNYETPIKCITMNQYTSYRQGILLDGHCRSWGLSGGGSLLTAGDGSQVTYGTLTLFNFTDDGLLSVLGELVELTATDQVFGIEPSEILSETVLMSIEAEQLKEKILPVPSIFLGLF